MRKLSIIGLTLLAGALASAQSQHQNFPAQDLNHDGVISQDEWQDTQHRFRQLDSERGRGVVRQRTAPVVPARDAEFQSAGLFGPARLLESAVRKRRPFQQYREPARQESRRRC